MEPAAGPTERPGWIQDALAPPRATDQRAARLHGPVSFRGRVWRAGARRTRYREPLPGDSALATAPARRLARTAGDLARRESTDFGAPPRGRCPVGTPACNLVYPVWLCVEDAKRHLARGRRGRSDPLLRRRRDGDRVALGRAGGADVPGRRRSGPVSPCSEETIADG